MNDHQKSKYAFHVFKTKFYTFFFTVNDYKKITKYFTMISMTY